MALTVNEAHDLLRSGAAALQEGNGQRARQLLERLVDAKMVNAQVLLLLARACRATGDAVGEEAAVDRLLAAEPNNLLGLIAKGDCRAQANDMRGATRFYGVALQASQSVQGIPGDLAAELERVRRYVDDANRHYKEHLQGFLAARGLGEGAVGARFQQSLDIMLGEKRIYHQQPSLYYFPELPQRQFYERDEFPWVEALEAQTDAIREELLAMLAEESGFRPYLVTNPNEPRKEYHGLTDNPGWSTLHLWENGSAVEANVARCPRTFEAVKDLPMPHITTRSPSILFSLLQPGVRIPPHTGVMNARLICHLPLIVPADCGFRVGNEVRQWEEGKLLIFDDTIEHEAWNDSASNRVVLIFDVWRPELSEEERRGITAIFEAVERFDADIGATPASPA